MDDNWWPKLLEKFAQEDPCADPDVVVAEIKSFDSDPGIPGMLFSTVALVSKEELENLGGKLIGFHHEVESNGPFPSIYSGFDYKPAFWISAINEEERIKCEPLILSWKSNNRTAMMLDPGFAMTYGLMLRAQADGSIHWDNPAAPEFDVAIIDPPSIYEDFRQTEARAVVSRDYLQDYLTLRDKILIQVYYVTRRGAHDEAIEVALGKENRVNIRLRDREVDIMRQEDGTHFVQIWGARVVAGPGSLPISSDPLDEVGLLWPGLQDTITNRVARQFRPYEGLIYVKDNVLKAYEGRPGFTVYPESGGVAFGNQWSVGPTLRVGRDVLQVEVRKLYEGTPPRIIQHWHDYAIDPTPQLASPEARNARNIGKRSKELVSVFVRLGQRLSDLASRLGLQDLAPENLTGLDPEKLDYEGWWMGPFIEPITRHIAMDMARDEFLQRCQALDKVLVEALSERYLRQVVKNIGSQTDTDTFRGLKLLDRIVCLAQVSNQSGLKLWESRDEIVDRLTREGTPPQYPLSKLFALSDLRQIASHRKDMDAQVPEALKRFELDASMAANGWGPILDKVYDGVIEQIDQAAKDLAEAL